MSSWARASDATQDGEEDEVARVTPPGVRARRAISAVALLACALVVLTAGSASAIPDPHIGQVQVGQGHVLNIRPGPSTSGAPIGTFQDGAPVPIECQVHGQWILGNWGWTDVWDQVQLPSDPSRVGWVSDGFVFTGTNALMFPC
jgi:hypothetical protein